MQPFPGIHVWKQSLYILQGKFIAVRQLQWTEMSSLNDKKAVYSKDTDLGI